MVYMKHLMPSPKQLRWDQYFLDISEVVSQKSKDPSTKNGCVIVDRNNRPISFGYNGLIQGSNEQLQTLSERPMKYHFVLHSEMNALIFAKRDLTGGTLYNRFATCENCLKHCLQAGITRFVYRELYVNSRGKSASMENYQTDEAIIRMLLAMPEVQTFNITTGQNYIDDILASYPPKSSEYQRLVAWVEKAANLSHLT